MDRKKSYVAVVILAVGGVVALYFSSIAKRPIEIDSGYKLVMGTFARAVIIATDSATANTCIKAAFAEIHKVDDLMSDYKSDSEISKINRDGFKQGIKVSQPTYEVLRRSVDFSKLTNGAFDITVGPLVDLWRSAKKTGVAPSKEEITKAKSRVGFEKLRLNEQNRMVQFAVEGMRLDLGGIAKGYAVDKAVEAMQKVGAIGGMVDIGGDIRCFGKPPRGKDHWVIGLQDPSLTKRMNEADLVLTLKLQNEAVATSGDYQRFVMIEGKKYGHILDRDTGTSTQGLSSVTIIARNATDADALATAVSVMGAEKGLALIEKLPNTEAILIRAPAEMTKQQKYELIKTSGAEEYIK
jgi:thiamine biosynthesis lipoprotein